MLSAGLRTVTALRCGWAATAATGMALMIACAAANREPVPTVVTVDPTRVGRAVPPAFLGLSIEWDSVAAYAGPRRHRRVALVGLLAPLVRDTGGLALRIGGDTADQAWWNPLGDRARRPSCRT